MKGLAAAVVVLTAAVATGCAEAVLRTGLPAGAVASGYDARWHDSFFFGTVEASPIRNVHQICPLGWSEIRARTSFATGLLQLFTLGIYSPTSVTVVCAAPAGVYLGSPAEVPLPPMCQ